MCLTECVQSISVPEPSRTTIAYSTQGPYIVRRIMCDEIQLQSPSRLLTIILHLLLYIHAYCFFRSLKSVNSILQQQAQLILNQQKLDEVKKLAKATKAAIKQNKAALGGSIGGSSVKGGYGTIGDLRYRNDYQREE